MKIRTRPCLLSMPALHMPVQWCLAFHTFTRTYLLTTGMPTISILSLLASDTSGLEKHVIHKIPYFSCDCKHRIHCERTEFATFIKRFSIGHHIAACKGVQTLFCVKFEFIPSCRLTPDSRKVGVGKHNKPHVAVILGLPHSVVSRNRSIYCECSHTETSSESKKPRFLREMWAHSRSHADHGQTEMAWSKDLRIMVEGTGPQNLMGVATFCSYKFMTLLNRKGVYQS